jgi:hypothetical protein
MKTLTPLITLLLAGCAPPVEAASQEPQPASERRVYRTSDDYITIWVDPGTGCHYIIYHVPGGAGGITPRLQPDDRIVCTE